MTLVVQRKGDYGTKKKKKKKRERKRNKDRQLTGGCQQPLGVGLVGRIEREWRFGGGVSD